MKKRYVAWILAVVCVVTLSVWRPEVIREHAPDLKPAINQPAESTALVYDRDILPILSNKCFTCHGPDAKGRKAGMRLDIREAALKPAKSGAVPIVPGKSGASEVVQRLFAEDAHERMPPQKGGKPLTEREKALLKRWIDQGAEYTPHWAFVKVKQPTIPANKNKSWGVNEIDAFILQRLETAGLKPAPAADRVTLIRRLSFDLRGLPPSLAEVDEFLADKSADAYPKLVDRILASPHYGERMALTWLDLARFGDTSGYHMDSTRQMHLWRDWVIKAFNDNMPFDQFTIEQLAGDLLPNPTIHQKIATGFNRNTRFNEEGGVDPEEYVVRYNVDRTNTVGAVWLGLTVGCAECHTHKYDPISHKEYYQLFAYFTGIKEPMAEGANVHGKPLHPILRVPTPAQAKELSELQAMAPRLEKAIDKELARFAYKDPLEGQKAPAEPTAEVARKSQIAWEVRAKGGTKLPEPVWAALEVEPGNRTVDQKAALRYYYLRKVHEVSVELIAPLDQDLIENAKKTKAIEDAVPYSLICEEMEKPRPAHVLIRGDFMQKGDQVERGVPSTFGALPADAPPNRLGLAHWLVRADNPLTARVKVNRLWAQMFGDGIVRTLGDFGTQGAYPTHLELLDWTANDFVKNGWDIKKTLRTIALSATYQQSSAVSSDSAKVDPHNRLFSYMPRHRHNAEGLRDNVLAISGLLNRKIGGPSFMPYQPPDYYKNKNEEWPWTASQGDEQYRRGIYAFWRRTALHPMFAILDAPSREECSVSRPRTNTPLHALVTLNDPTFVEAARVFAQRILTDGPKDMDGRLAFAFRGATSRIPNESEMTLLRDSGQRQLDRFRADKDAASKLVNIGQYPQDANLDVSELAGWTALANMILNLDEVLTRE